MKEKNSSADALKDTGLEIAKIAFTASEDKKAILPIVLDVSEFVSICTYVVIVSQKTKPQVKGLALTIERELKEQGYEIEGKEGYKASQWILLDYGEVLINIMHQPERDFYRLEEIWRKAPEIEFKD